MSTKVMMKRHPVTAIALGYRNVLWYRGGLEAWNHAQLPFARRGDSSNRSDRG